MNRRTFLTGSALGGAALLTVGGRADAAEWTALERAKMRAANDHFARGRRAAGLGKYDEALVEYQLAAELNPTSLEDWNKKMAEFAVEDLMFTAHSVGDFKPQVKIAAGPGPFTHITMTILETFAKGPIVVTHRIDRFASKTRPLTWEGVGVFLVQNGKIKEWFDYTIRVDRS